MYCSSCSDYSCDSSVSIDYGYTGSVSVNNDFNHKTVLVDNKISAIVSMTGFIIKPVIMDDYEGRTVSYQISDVENCTTIMVEEYAWINHKK